ncbi:MAG: primase [Thermodesulfobacteriota bacterium]|nr:primase [Thermodesulfobacteriota bacterium]
MAFFIPEEKITEIKNAADIVDIISGFVLLKKSGRNHLGLCPFHAEKTPSFTVSNEKQIFYCFGCGAGGNVFAFLMKKEGLTFPEAIKYIAGKYGIDVPAESMTPEQKKRVSEKESLLSVNKQAMDFFCKALFEGDSGKKAFEYLKKRSISEQTIRDYRIGYAPESWNSLYNYLIKKRIPLGQIEKAGLIIQRSNSSGFYDRFRDRIIFPIFDPNSQVIGFGGRVMDDSLPKYLNSPETALFSKSRSLYGLNAARSECRITETVYIVEGYFDLLSLHQHGIRNSVATLGTAITPEHVQMLRGIIGKDGKFILVYDSDDAGIKAAYRSIEIFDRGYADAKILVLPSGYDPDSYLVKYGVESFRKAVSGSLGAVSFLINCAIKKHGLSIEGKIRVISELKTALVSITDQVARSLYIRELAEKIDIDEYAINERIKEAENGRKNGITLYGAGGIMADREAEASARRNASSSGMGKGSRLERQIIAMMLQFPEILPEIIKRDVLSNFADEDLRSIGKAIIEKRSLRGIKTPGVMQAFDDEEQNRIAAFLAINDDAWTREGCIRLMAQFEYSRKRQKDTSTKKIKAAEEIKDEKLLLELLKEKQIQALKKKKNNLKASGGEKLYDKEIR